MQHEHEPGLGELLRHLTELVDRGAEEVYREELPGYRPRYTPVMRALSGGDCTISEITERVFITQGAVSQIVSLMEDDGLVRRTRGSDGRQTTVSLTPRGLEILNRLRTRWQITFRAIDALEGELGVALRAGLGQAVTALERKGFAQRLRDAAGTPEPGGVQRVR